MENRRNGRAVRQRRAYGETSLKRQAREQVDLFSVCIIAMS
jgi:hypothetical protein